MMLFMRIQCLIYLIITHQSKFRKCSFLKRNEQEIEDASYTFAHRFAQKEMEVNCSFWDFFPWVQVLLETDVTFNFFSILDQFLEISQGPARHWCKYFFESRQHRMAIRNHTCSPTSTFIFRTFESTFGQLSCWVPLGSASWELQIKSNPTGLSISPCRILELFDTLQKFKVSRICLKNKTPEKNWATSDAVRLFLLSILL